MTSLRQPRTAANIAAYTPRSMHFGRRRLLKLVVVAVVLCMSVVACGSAPGATGPTNTTTSPSQGAASQVPTGTGPAATSPGSNSVAACKLPALAFTNVGLGIPGADYRLPSKGEVKTIVLFADFNDVPAAQTPEAMFGLISPKAEEFYATESGGRMTWKLQPNYAWLRLGQPSATYGNDIRSYDGHLQFIQEAVSLADPTVDFSGADSVVVLVPPEATAIGYGPAFAANEGQGFVADGKTFANGVTSGADLRTWGSLWLNHESGHTMGLPDLYAFTSDGSQPDIHRFVGGFGLMGYILGSAPEYFAYERWQLGWLDDNQVVCLAQGDTTQTLSAIETAGGLKAVVIPLDGSRAVVVESRRALGYDSKLPKSGALVYEINTSTATGLGPIVIHPIDAGDPWRYTSPLAPGESVTVDGVTVSVTSATDQADVVKVTIAN